VGERFVILGTLWADSVPFLLVKTAADDHAHCVPVAGFEFRYRARADLPRVCIGHRLEPGDRVCTKAVQVGTRTCRSCAIEAALFASDLHHAHRREPTGALTDHLDQPNVLYVAGFGDGSLKIGTSVAGRLETRLSEQGARFARVVARTHDGVIVRVLEDLVTQTLALSQTVSISRKLKGLIDPRPDSEVAELVDERAAQVEQQLVGVSGWEPAEESWSNPILDNPNWDRTFGYPRNLGVGAHDLVALGACGRIALLSRPDPNADRFGADLKQLYGVWLERGVFDTPDIAAQHTLF
jgi:hypothetical protein